MEDVKQSVREQFGAVAARYARSWVHREAPDLDALVEAAALRGDERVLDAGCGAGHTGLALAKTAREVVALDLTPDMLDQVRALAREQGRTNLVCELGDVEALPFPDDSFDVVSSRLSAHHYPTVERAVSEWARVLRPGGRLLLSDTISPEEASFDTFLNTIELLRDPSHVRNHRVSEWLALLGAHGFEASLLGRFEFVLDFESWFERMRTAPESAERIVWLFEQAPPGVQKTFGFERGSGHWSIPVALLGGRLSSAG